MTSGKKAIVAKRSSSGRPDTEEIRGLARAAGYDVQAEVTQTRPEDKTYQIGEGKVAEVAELLRKHDATTVIVDNRLTPKQAFNVCERCPDETYVLDRVRLILDIFEEQAEDPKAQLQVKLATLNYELPRVREQIMRDVEHEMKIHDEEGKEVEDLKDQIDTVKKKLDEISESEERRRQKRREQGFDLVALVGYTNTGKTTLLRRIADDMSLQSPEETHDDIETSAEIEDRLFKTLQTTTRRAETERRNLLVTDTVGLVEGIHHQFVESFQPTLGEGNESDVVLLVIDASEPLDDLLSKVDVCLDVLSDADGEIVPVLNKIDLLSETELAARRDRVAEVLSEPVCISALEGDGIDALKRRISESLPELSSATLTFPTTGDGMSFLSWLHDNGHVEEITYADDGETVTVEFRARRAAVEKAQSKSPSSG